MPSFRIAIGLVSLVLASVPLFHFFSVFRPVVVPTLRQLGQEQTTYFVMHVAGFSLSGWHILAFEGILLVLGVGLACFGVYVLVVSKPEA